MFGKKKKKYEGRTNLFLGNLEEAAAKREGTETGEAPASPAPAAPSPAPVSREARRPARPRRAVRALTPVKEAPAPEGEPEPEKEPEPEREPEPENGAPAPGTEEENAPAPAKGASAPPPANTDIFDGFDAPAAEEAAHPFGATAFVESFREQAEKTPVRKKRARRDLRRKAKLPPQDLPGSGRLRAYIRGEEDSRPKRKAENGVDADLMDLYAPEGGKKKKRALTPADWVRYAILFLCIFGFLIAGYFVVSKLADYYRGSALYRDLADLVTTRDRFADEYLARSAPMGLALTIEDVFNGKTDANGVIGAAANREEQELIAKILRLKQINPDTAGWITIDNTVVNYPVMWTKTRNYYLHRDFYGKNLGAGAIFMDERNSPDISKNRNTVIYGHNMADGSMFASLHDFSNPSTFYNASIRLVTTDGIYVYKAFSVHQSDAYDNYFETQFTSDRSFEEFVGNMAAISMFDSDQTVGRSSRILTLSTCESSTLQNNERYVVQAVLVDVIR